MLSHIEEILKTFFTISLLHAQLENVSVEEKEANSLVLLSNALLFFVADK